MRVALISDIHGNAVALQAVLDDAWARGADRVVCLGDVATLGPQPREVIALLRRHAQLCILGNHDEFLLDPLLIQTYTEAPVVVASVDWCRAQLQPDDLAFLRSFQAEATIDLGHGATLHVFHGSPTSHMQNLLATTPPDELDGHLAGRVATVLAGGHTHVQMLRQHKGMLLVNPGSVGAPFREVVGTTPPVLLGHAEYALVESDESGGVAVILRRVAVDGAAARAAVRGLDHPLQASLQAQYGEPT